MSFFKNVKSIGEDFALWIKLNKLKFLLTTLVAFVAIVVGCVIFTSCQQGWWYANRCKHVELLLCGNFLSTLVSLLFEAVLVLILAYIAQINKYFSLMPYVVLFVGGLYCGAHLACLFLYIGIVAVLFLAFYTLLSVAILLIPCFVKGYPTEYCKTHYEIWSESKNSFLTIVLLSILKILILFLLLRPICGSI